MGVQTGHCPIASLKPKGMHNQGIFLKLVSMTHLLYTPAAVLKLLVSHKQHRGHPLFTVNKGADICEVRGYKY